MKNAVRVLALTVLLTFSFGNAEAQKASKFGHFSSQDLIQKMPEYTAAQDTLKNYVEQLRTDLESMQKEFDNLQADYQAKKDQLSNLLKQNKEKELQDAYTRIQTFQANSQQEINTKQNELMNSIMDKVRNAVEQVAKENHYDYIFESNGILWYSNDSDDVSSLIEKKLNLKK